MQQELRSNALRSVRIGKNIDYCGLGRSAVKFSSYRRFEEFYPQITDYRIKQIIERIGAGVGQKAVGKRPLGRPRRRWVYNIKINLREIKLSGVGWIDLA
jgi:hypothetical protein